MPDTHYAIMHVERIKTTADLEGATRHGRRQDTSTHFDLERTPYNRHWAGLEVTAPVDWVLGVEDAIERLGATTRKDASVAADFFVGASSEYFHPADGDNSPFDMPKVMRWAEANMAAFYERFGRAVVAARLDLDEGSPHMSICVLPVYMKKTKHKEQPVVSYRKVIGAENRLEARKSLIELQDWYAAKMAPLGLERGVPKTVTHRGHMTHQEYARKKDQEDQDRKKALADAEQLVADVQRRNDDLEKRLEVLRDKEQRTQLALEAASALLLDADRAHAWIQEIRDVLAERVDTLPIVEAMDKAQPAFEKYAAHVAKLIERIDGKTDEEIDVPRRSGR